MTTLLQYNLYFICQIQMLLLLSVLIGHPKKLKTHDKQVFQFGLNWHFLSICMICIWTNNLKGIQQNELEKFGTGMAHHKVLDGWMLNISLTEHLS